MPAAAFVLLGGRFYGMASDTFINIVLLAVKVETVLSDVVGYELASKPTLG